jgi:MOSC domain-containing protein
VAYEGVGRVEEAWIGAELLVGSARLRIDGRTTRCVTTALAQEDLAFAPAIPRALKRHNAFCFGVYATVLDPAVVHLNDEVQVTRAM